MARYGWIVTKDRITQGALPSRVGWTGPREADNDVLAALKAGQGIEWRTGPDGVRSDGGGWSYYGRVVDLDAEAQTAEEMDADALSSPLDNLGAPDAGDATIEHKNAKGEWELVIG